MNTNNAFDTVFLQTSRVFIPFFIIFVVLGFLVLIGFGKEVKTVLTSVFHGAMQLFLIAKILRNIYRAIVKFLQRLMFFLSPFISAAIAIGAYMFLMYLYKYVGLTNNIAGLTIFLTIILTIIIKSFPKGSKGNISERTFWDLWFEKTSRILFDFFEIMVFVFFITLDWVQVPFLPQKLWIHLVAYMAEYDLMIRGLNFHFDFFFTLWLAGFAFFAEFIRQAFKIIHRARYYYITLRSTHPFKSRLDLFEQSVSESFYYSLADLVTFFGYTTVVMITFFLFPRLKLLSLIFFSLASLAMDIFKPSHTPVGEEPQDFLTRVVIKSLNLKHEGDQNAVAVRVAAKIRGYIDNFINNMRPVQ